MSSIFFWAASSILLVGSLFAICRRRSSHHLFSFVILLASSCMIALALLSIDTPMAWQGPGFLAVGPWSFTFVIDRLSALFLALLGTVGIASALFSPRYLRHLDSRMNSSLYWAAYCLFVLSMMLVFVSGDGVTFLVFWELMALSSTVLVSSEHTLHRVQRATIIYLGATRTSTAFIAFGFIWLYSMFHSWRFSDWCFDRPESYGAALLLMIGFCIKAGIWPFHIWLPYAHPAAPTPVSALMSGVMIKTAVYGVVRILLLGNLNCAAIGYLAVTLGVVSAFWGVLFALVQNDLKRLLAYSSVENVGLIFTCIGIAILSRSVGVPEVAALGLAAGLFHCLSHGFFKTLLFFGAGSIDVAAHTIELGQLGGLVRQMPWTMSCFVLGAVGICALPPLNGFPGKWLLYQSLFRNVWLSSSLIDRGLCLAIICILAVVGGLALACFAKAVAVIFLGVPRSKQSGAASEGSSGMVCAQVFLAIGCVALGLTVPQILLLVKPVCDLAVHTNSHIESAFTVDLRVTAIALIVLVLALSKLVLSGSQVRISRTWDCGFGPLGPRTQVTSDSFAQPVARIFRPILRYKLEFELTGTDRRHFPEKIRVKPNMVSLLEQRVYLPLLSIVSKLAKSLVKLQAGSIHLYLIYLCVTLILLLQLGTLL
ncbi:MAG: hypothetical protein K2X93_11055 [Candidatus Obscuribacterales bacterium]|nr:hypothetical protein [Candidatus Obscuribacterales bacterium]